MEMVIYGIESFSNFDLMFIVSWILCGWFIVIYFIIVIFIILLLFERVF